MNCNTIREWTDEYLDGMLSHESVKALEAHLENCPDCLQYINQAREMLGILTSIQEEELPEGFHHRLYERLEAAAEEKISVRLDNLQSKRWIKWGAGIAAAVTLIFSIHFFNKTNWLGSKAEPLPDLILEENAAANDQAAKMAMPKDAAEADMAAHDADSATAGEYEGTQKDEEAPMLMSAMIEEEISEDTARSGDSNVQNDENTDPQSHMQKASIGMLTDQGIDESALSGEFSLYVKDAQNIEEKITLIADTIGMQVVEESENAVILQITDESQRADLYRSLFELGTVEDRGIFSKDNTITVYIIVK